MTRYSTTDLRSNLGQPVSALKPSAAPKSRRSYEESENQVALFSWWEVSHAKFGAARHLMFAIPNGSALGTGKEDWQVKQRIIRGKRLKAEGLTPGVFDIFVSVPRQGRCGMFVEMKRKGGEPSPEQIAFKTSVEAQGYATAICYSSMEAIDAITFYLTK